MICYRKAAVERAMKVQEVILRAMAKKITWWQAAEIIGLSDRSMRRWRERYEEFGYDGLFDRRQGKPSPKRVAVAVVEQVLGLYRDRYACDWGEPYFLYDGPPRSFSDPKTEFEHWTEHIWGGFNEEIARLDQIHGPRKRQGQATRQELKDRIRRRVAALYPCMKTWIRGLSYDLAVLQAQGLSLRQVQAFDMFPQTEHVEVVAKLAIGL